MPRDENGSRSKEHTALLYKFAEVFPFSYVIDLDAYAPVYDAEFRKYFFMGGHLNAAGYLFTARMFSSYIDYIIRHNPDDFTQIGFVLSITAILYLIRLLLWGISYIATRIRARR